MQIFNSKKVILINLLLATVLFLALAVSISSLKLSRSPEEMQKRNLRSSQPVVVMFYSEKCSDCRDIASKVKLIEYVTNLKGSRRTIYFSWQNKKDKKYFYKNSINRVPSFMIFKKNKPLKINSNSNNPYVYSGTNLEKIKRIYTLKVLQ